MALPRRRRRRQPSPSADAIAGNEDLLTDILIRLPVKLLCRFKSVSKQWNSLISNPYFSLLRMPKSVSGLLVPVRYRAKRPVYKYVHLSGKRTRSSPFKSLSFVDDPLGIKIMQSCNGLLLCSSAGYCSNRNYYIYNPTTKQFAIIPPLCDVAKQPVCAMVLAFDPYRPPHYKLISIRSRPRFSASSWSKQIEIYSSETDAWRLSGDSITGPLCIDSLSFDLGHVVFFNGRIHLVSWRLETSISFDTDKECLETMPMAKTFQNRKNQRSTKCFGQSRGHLHLIYGYNYSNGYYHEFDIIEMQNDRSKWVVKCHLHLDGIPTTILEYPSLTKYSILHFDRGEREEESHLVLYIHGILVSYNFKDKTVRKLCKLAATQSAQALLENEGWLHVHQYSETLFGI